MTQAKLELVPEGTANSQRVAVLNQPLDIQMRHALIPEPGDGEIRVKITYVGICGSDLEAYRGLRQPEFMSLPMRLGHEVAGVIDKLGANVLGLAVGDKVTCRYVWGAFAEYIVCKPFNVKVLPHSFPMLEISLIEILPGVIHAAELGDIKPGVSKVLITGQGVSGLVITQVVAQYSPAVLVVTDLKERNLELARKYGATHTYQVPSEHTPTMDVVGKDFSGFDVVIPCLLDGDGMMDALHCLNIGGKIVSYGCIGTCKEFDFFKFHRKRATLVATEPRSDVQMRKFFQEGIQMVLDGLVNTGEMVTHIYPLERVREAFELRNDKSVGNKAIHVLIDCERSKDGKVKDIIVIKHGEKEGMQGSGDSSGGETCC